VSDLEQHLLSLEVLEGLDTHQQISVGSVNFALPLVTATREPSETNVIGLFGRDREISASNFPGTKTFPGSLTSAAKVRLACCL